MVVEGFEYSNNHNLASEEGSDLEQFKNLIKEDQKNKRPCLKLGHEYPPIFTG